MGNVAKPQSVNPAPFIQKKVFPKRCGVKLIAGIIASSENIFFKTEEALQRILGPLDYRSQTIKFDFTDYYQRDMGPDLKRRFVSFERLIDPTALSRIKLITNRLERRLSKDIKSVRRAVNIDPGYITGAKLVLASTKDYSHRIYLEKGIYAEVTLYYKKGSFRYWDWTYPDYKTEDYIRIFNEIRSIYMRQKHRATIEA